MAKIVVAGDGYFSIGEYSFPKSEMFLQVRGDEFTIRAVAGNSSLDFKLKDLVDSEEEVYASDAAAIADLQAVMFLPEVVLVVPDPA